MALRGNPPDGTSRELVLVVDDDAEIAETTALMLRERGLDPVTETNPSAVLDALDDRFGCVVSDYQMPRMNGLELLEEVQAEHPDLPFIMFTARGSEAIASEAIEAGVCNYFQKGKQEQYDRLAKAVETGIDRYQTERELTKRRRQFEAVFETAFDGLFILDMDEGIIVDANPRACELLEYSYEDLIGTDIAKVHPDDYEEYMEIGRNIIESDERRRVESVCYTRNDNVIPSDITAAPMEYEGKTFLLTVMRPQQTDR